MKDFGVEIEHDRPFLQRAREVEGKRSCRPSPPRPGTSAPDRPASARHGRARRPGRRRARARRVSPSKCSFPSKLLDRGACHAASRRASAGCPIHSVKSTTGTQVAAFAAPCSSLHRPTPAVLSAILCTTGLVCSQEPYRRHRRCARRCASTVVERGKVAEWFKAAVLKTARGCKPTVGSNPTLSARMLVLPTDRSALRLTFTQSSQAVLLVVRRHFLDLAQVVR